MLVVETIAKIRRAYFVYQKPIKEICRELRISRKVVRKVIRSGATEFRYERETQPFPKIGPWRDRLDSLLIENEGKSSREQLTLVRLFEELRGFGYEGGYDAVRRYVKSWRKERGATLAQAYRAEAPRGEIVLVIAPPPAVQRATAAETETLLRQALARVSLKDAVGEVADATGLPRREIYQRALALAKTAKDAGHGAPP